MFQNRGADLITTMGSQNIQTHESVKGASTLVAPRGHIHVHTVIKRGLIYLKATSNAQEGGAIYNSNEGPSAAAKMGRM